MRLRSIAHYWVALLSLVALAPAAVSAQTTDYQQDLALPIYRSDGQCPTTVRLWTNARPYEGGAEHTVIVNTKDFAGDSFFVDSSDRHVIFAAPLTAAYRNCVGWVTAPDNPEYNIWLQFGHVYMRFDLERLAGTGSIAAITYQDVLNGQPYMQWQQAD